MCGIAGLVDPTGAPIDQALLGAMTRALAPRGPDGEGLWAGPGVGLGHRRLAVIDLSAAADQPLANETGDVRVVFNGELYNFADLRAELLGAGHRFASRSDTEVLVHGYEQWGDDLVDRIDGMFAFALWDARRRRLLAARDRMGKKPLYFAEVPRPGAPPLFAFGSELKALAPVPGLDRAVDPVALSRYLVQEHVAPPRSIWRGARKLDAGERLRLEAGERPAAPPAIDRYWSIPFPETHEPARAGEAVADLRFLLRRAVERRLVADVPLGAFLSGGIDSSAVVALMAELAGADRVKTFSIGFSDASFDETAHARKVAERFHTEHHEDVLGPRALLDALPDVGRFLDEPLGDASIVPTFLLSRFARRHVTVALGGDGGDELFSGYPTFQAELPGRLYFEALPPAARALLARAAARLRAGTDYFSLDFKIHQFLRGGETPGPIRHQRWLASFLPDELDRVLLPDLRRAGGADPLADVAAHARATAALDPADQLMAFYARFYLGGDVNVKVDRAAGACGLEVRAPFLDTDLVTFAALLPPRLRARGLATKVLLKRAMRGLLPDEIIDRPKRGFGVPVARWMKEDLRPALLDELSPDRLRRQGLFDPGAVAAIVDDHLAGRRDRRKQLWTLFVFQRWHGAFGG